MSKPKRREPPKKPTFDGFGKQGLDLDMYPADSPDKPKPKPVAVPEEPLNKDQYELQQQLDVKAKEYEKKAKE